MLTAEFATTHSDVKIEIQQIIIEGDRDFLEWSWSDTDQVTQTHQVDVNIMTLKDS